LLVGLSIVNYKRTDDILEGISKLDHLLMVSVFQRYKGTEVEIEFSEEDDNLGTRSFRDADGNSFHSSQLPGPSANPSARSTINNPSVNEID
jgi:hypothetical protein